MAKRLTEIVIERQENQKNAWYVYADQPYDDVIRKVEGVIKILRHPGEAHVVVYIDPRYDADELDREIVELCR